MAVIYDVSTIGNQPNSIYSEAIELVCGGPPIGCALVERKAQHKVKKEQQQHRTNFDQLLYNTSVESWVKWTETICSSHFPLYRDLPLYEVHKIRRAATVEPNLWSRGGLVNSFHSSAWSCSLLSCLLALWLPFSIVGKGTKNVLNSESTLSMCFDPA